MRNKGLRIGGWSGILTCNRTLRQEDRVEHGMIEREVRIEASPATVFEVLTSPEHLAEWWPDEAVVEATPGFDGELVFGDRSSGTAQLRVLEVVPPERFSFRWTHADGEEPSEGNSLLVVFELTPSGDGTLLRMTETGFREMGWAAAVLEEQLRDHETGWDHFLPRLVAYAPKVQAPS
jgi:uncharacterized protein YndB with AHSA1/START domain